VIYGKTLLLGTNIMFRLQYSCKLQC